MKILLIFTAVWIALGALTFSHFEGWTALESVYFCHETLTTIGYGDFFPQTTAGQAALVIFAILGMNSVAMLLTVFARYLKDIERLRVRNLMPVYDFKQQKAEQREFEGDPSSTKKVFP